MSPFKPLFTSFKTLSSFAILGLLMVLAMGGTAAASRIGVGVGTGRISLDQGLKPGLTYELPKLAVFNNGDVASDYEMSMQFNETQPQRKPVAKWVKFSPQRFNLQPGKSRQVTITLQPSSSAHPGNYFAYLEAHPLKKDVSGETAINIAAATKLSFKVVPANIFQKLYYMWLDFWNKHKPVIIIVVALLLLAVIVTLAKKYLHIELRAKKY